MAKDKISDYSATANSNTDIGGINIDEGCAPSGINDAIRTLMKQLKDWQSGSQDVYIHPAGSASVPSITATGDTNTGLFFPAADTIGITTGGTERARVDSSGNLGLGVTPSTIDLGKFLEVGQLGCGVWTPAVRNIVINSNAYYNGGNKYATTGAAGTYQIANGIHYWYNAPSGTAGNAITFTQAMTLDASGNLIVGGTTWYGKITSVGGTFALVTNTASQRRLSFWSTANGDSENAYIQVQNDGATTNTGEMLFATKNSGGTLAERARIDANGNFMVGTTTVPAWGDTTGFGFAYDRTNATTHFKGNSSTSVALTYFNATSFTSGTGYFAQFRVNGSTVGNITTNGSTTSYATSSDYRLKENIAPMTGALAKVAALKPVTYTWKSTGEADEGFIAHELQDVCPSAVTGEKDAVDTNGNPVYQGIDTSFLVATLTAAIQELNAKFEAYKATHP